MPRYIDADKLIDMCEGIIANDWNKRTSPVSWADAYEGFIEDIDEQPTADVVPKSEVERLTKELDALAEEHNDLIVEKDHLFDEVERLKKENTELLVSATTDILVSMEKLVKVRTEHPIFKAIEEKVASEIFEEIEQQLRGLFDFFRQDGCIRESSAIMLAISEIAALKKKYTEVNNENANT